MIHLLRRFFFASLLLLASGCARAVGPPSATPNAVSDNEFVGPFANWANLKRNYGAKGDGQNDDTAALQKALDDLKNESKPKVLFLPAGTYRITKTLEMASHINVGVIGESPDNTIIRWDGVKGGTMLHCNGVRYSRFGRITWDGNKQAGAAVAHQWDGTTPGANSHNEHADEVFKDIGFGIRAGLSNHMDAECAVLRCKFLRCSSAGVSIESFNSLDWWIRDSYFEGCLVGVTNDPGAGNFHIYDCFFKGSTQADIKYQNASYFGIRGNTSIGSEAFLIAARADSASPTTIQGNTIIAPAEPNASTIIQAGSRGMLLLLDNTINRTSYSVALSLADRAISVGNTFVGAYPFRVYDVTNGRDVLQIGDKVVSSTSLDDLIAQKTKEAESLPHFAPNLHRKIIEVAAGSNGAAIQAAIDEAVNLGQRAVVHLPAGAYAIAQTLTIPANSDIQLIGDGFATRLQWKGGNLGTVFLLAGPSRAIVRDLEIQAGSAANGVLVENSDQIGARIFMEQGEVIGSRGVGLLANGLDNAEVSLYDFYHSNVHNATGDAVAVKAIGGPQTAAGKDTTARVAIFGGASSDNDLSYDLTNNASLLAEDIWYEGIPPRFINFTDKSSGSFTLNGATAATGKAANQEVNDPNFAALQINGFRGKVSLLGVTIGTRLVISGDSPQTEVLASLLGFGDYFLNQSKDARVALYASNKYTTNGGSVTIAAQGKADPDFVTKMLTQLRTTRSRPITELPQGVTDVRFYRVTVSGGGIGFNLSR